MTSTAIITGVMYAATERYGRYEPVKGYDDNGTEQALADHAKSALAHYYIVRDTDDGQEVLADGWYDAADSDTESPQEFAARLFAEARG